MSTAASAAGRPGLDAGIAVAGIAALGVGTVVGLAGAAGGAVGLALAGGGVAAAALTLLMAAGWVPPLVVLALTLPLPALYGTESVRIAPAAAVTALVLLSWAMHRVMAPRVDLGALPWRATLALFASILLAAAFADARGAAAREVLNFALLLGLLVVAVDLLARDRQRVHRLAVALAVVTGAAGALAALQSVAALPAVFPLSGTPFHRANLGFGWPNELGVYFAIALPLCWYVARTAAGPAGRFLARSGLLLGGLGLLATFSRGAWLAFLLGSMVLLVAGGVGRVVRIAVGVAIAVALVDVLAGGAVTGRLWSLGNDPFVIQRAALMLVGVLMFLANPIVGVGPGGFRENLEVYGPGVPWLWDYVGSAHNAFLELAAEAGVAGLAAFLWFIVAIFRVVLRRARQGGGDAVPGTIEEREATLRRALLWAYTTAVLACFTAWPFAHGVGQLMMLVIAMGVASAVVPASVARREERA